MYLLKNMEISEGVTHLGHGASADNTVLDLHNSLDTQPYSIIAKCILCILIFNNNDLKSLNFVMENISRIPWCRTRALNIKDIFSCFCFCPALIWVQSRGGLNFFLQNSWTATPLFLTKNNPPLSSLWLDLSCDYFSVELPISFSTSWSRKISYQVNLNQSETGKYFERI